ncbi:MAG: FtsH protease activity modulator HflK, partial [Armatimonadota bacterium]
QSRVKDAAAYLFAAADTDKIVRAASEAAVRSAVGVTPLDDIFTTDRRDLEQRIERLAQAALDAYGVGVEVLTARLQDVHPPLEVVDAFRDVSSAIEEKARMINEAEAYANDILPRARGTAAGDIRAAQAYSVSTPTRARGAAERFARLTSAYRRGPEVTATRLYLETIEAALADLDKVILDSAGGRRQMLLLGQRGLQVVPSQTFGTVPLPPPAEEPPTAPRGEAGQPSAGGEARQEGAAE